jgi:hypothetical protein
MILNELSQGGIYAGAASQSSKVTPVAMHGFNYNFNMPNESSRVVVGDQTGPNMLNSNKQG